jgi:hypothetical protein
MTTDAKIHRTYDIPVRLPSIPEPQTAPPTREPVKVGGGAK